MALPPLRLTNNFVSQTSCNANYPHETGGTGDDGHAASLPSSPFCRAAACLPDDGQRFALGVTGTDDGSARPRQVWRPLVLYLAVQGALVGAALALPRDRAAVARV